MVKGTQTRGSRIASIIMGLFGGCWLLSSLLVHLAPFTTAYATILFPLSAAVATVMMRRIPHASSNDTDQVEIMQRHMMWATYALELTLISALVYVLARNGLSHLLTSIVGIAVGVHFFPIAAAFRYAPYYILGSVITAVGVAGGTVLEGAQWLMGTLIGILLIIAAVMLRKH